MTKVAKTDKREICYSSHSKTYDQQRFWGTKNAYLEGLRRQVFLRHLRSVPRDSQLLDVGCGTGRGLMYLANAGFKNLTGLDYTREMLDQAQAKVDTLSPDFHVKLVQGSAFEMEFPEESFDAVITLNFLHMFRLDRQAELVRQMHRVCKRGGLVVAEFESIHKGLFFTRYLEQKRVKESTKFNSIGEIRQLFPSDLFSSYRVFGTELPVVYRVLHLMPGLGTTLETTVTSLPLLKWAAARVIVGARKK